MTRNPVTMPDAASDPLLADLTDPQREAVLATEGPVLVLAAAGSGKTRVITRRIVHLMNRGVPPWAVLALTFPNKAAGEMRERVHALVSHAAARGGPLTRWGERAMRGLTITTFHALCARLLRRYAEPAGLKPDYTIYDDSDQLSLVKRVVADLQLSTSNWPPRSVLSAISDAKNKLIEPEAYASRSGDFYTRTIARVYAAYQRALHDANAVDFDDLLLRVARTLRRDAAVRDECRGRWRYLLIDEYQDTNRAQFEIASLLAGDPDATPASASPSDAGAGIVPPPSGPNICVVGDPDQSIYGWRGADITNILEFERHYPAARVIKLGENFRSTRHILAAADALIKKSTLRKDKPLFTSRPGGEKPTCVLCRDEQHESTLVADWLREMHTGPDPFAWKDMAVFYRANALSRVMEDALRQAGVPYTIARGTAFFDREEIKHAVAYLRVVANQADTVSLERILNVPARGIGATTLARADAYAAEQGLTLFESLRRADRVPGLTGKAAGAIAKFVALIDEWTGGGTFMGELVPTSLADLVERVIRESGLEQMYRDQARVTGSETDEQRLDNLDELVSSARQFEMEYDASQDPAASMPASDLARGDTSTPFDDFDFGPADASPNAGAQPAPPPGGLLAMLRAYLESITLIADADAVDPEQGAVTLMTLHAAKGLEFPVVAIIGLEEGLLPHSRSVDSPQQVEEERRLLFVGMTRAMRHLHLSCAKYRTSRGLSERTIVSRFVAELPREHVILSDQADIDGGLGAAWGEDDDPFADGPSPKPASGPRRVVPVDDHGREHPFPVGALVRHPQFGTGTVKSVIGGAQARAVIDFKGVGPKTLVLEYARLTRLR